jgi:hypothetical protein
MERSGVLRSYEWCVIGVLVLALGYLTHRGIHADSSRWPAQSGQLSAAPVPLVTVTVAGEVQKPGKYRIKKGSTVKELLLEIGLTPAAEISAEVLDERILYQKKIRIKKKLR